MNKLKLIRLEKGLTQIELALATGVPRYVIQLHETGTRTPSIKEQERLADVLGVKRTDIFLSKKFNENLSNLRAD